ncbi:chlorophyll a/b binding light-harvesting protein [Leptothoe sp. LEGE 181152]|nr:chlorophyll a/b binding light-harvesting protein [Leptothoe sp. LEGE 181152]
MQSQPTLDVAVNRVDGSSSLSQLRDFSWLQGNARLINRTELLLGAHLAHAGLIMFWAGSFTLLEISRYVADVPLADQGLLLLPRLVNLGWGTDNVEAWFAIAILHLASSAVLAAGGLFHVFNKQSTNYAVGDDRIMAKEEGLWSNPETLSFILGQHLIILGFAASLFVLKATRFGGIYDPLAGSVHLVENATTNPAVILGYLFGFTRHGWDPMGMAAVDNLPDLVGGHIWISVICILGGIWHTVRAPFGWFREKFIYDGHVILSYSLAGVGLMALISIFFVFNELVYPIEIFGDNRLETVVLQAVLAVVFLGGHVWHNLLGQKRSGRFSESSYYEAAMAGFATILVVALAIGLNSVA